MANDNNNINELVSEDDDPTAEFEQLGRTHGWEQDSGEPSISELQSDLDSRSETINRLQFDIEQFRAKWNGLEAEIKARQEITENLNREIAAAHDTIDRKEKLIRKRDQSIKALKAEIRERNESYGELQARLEEVEQHDDQRRIDSLTGKLAGAEAEIRELRAQIERTESYANDIRHQLRDRTRVSEAAIDGRDFLEKAVNEATGRIEALEAELAEANTNCDALRQQIDNMHSEHAEEIRLIRFELTEAEETMAEQELIAEQLASDLVDTRGYRVELEKMLAESEESSVSRIEKLEQQNRELLSALEDRDQKLETKSEAINCLLEELAKKSQQIDSIAEIENVIYEIDDRMSERVGGVEKDRVTRLLVGSLDGQELRFPLFKNRLTIGRTEQNDIQLKANYVSRRHAVVVTDRDAPRVIDWGSKNGVFVNGRRVTEHFLKNGDMLTIGTADFRYEERPRRDA
jgi:chromosome segregation ATPase